MVDIRKFLYSLVAVLGLALGAQAQFIGYVAPQTQTQTLASAVNCTGASQLFPISNLGQTQHYLTSPGSGATAFRAQLEGVDGAGNITVISDPLQTGGTVAASGYFPILQARVNCTPTSATFTLTYSGAWGTFNTQSGGYLLAQVNKLLFRFSNEAANQTNTLQTPFSSTAGELWFTYSAAAAGGSIQVNCNTANSAGGPIVFTSTLANTSSLQNFSVPAFNCPNVTVTYNNNGQAGTIFAEYVFNTPNSAVPPGFGYTHVTGTTATVVKGTAPAFLHTLNVNTSAAGTISIFDLATASCTGTPATNVVAVITTPAATNVLPTDVYDFNFLNGICVKASVAMDFTVTAQ